MAEKYGTIPKKFTPEWREYIWMYYKSYILAALFIIVLAAVTIYQFVTAPKYDLTIAYAGNITLTEDMSDKVSKKISPYCDDLDKNGKKSVNLQQFNTNSKSDLEYATAMMQKLDLMLTDDEVYIYILDEALAKRNIGEKPEDSAFATLDKWLDADIDSLETLDFNGASYAVKLTDCKVFKDLEKGINANFSDKYLFIRYYPRKDQSEQLAGWKASVKLANKLINGK